MNLLRGGVAVAALAASTLVFVGTEIATSLPAGAEGSACPVKGNWFDGYFSTSSTSTWIGISADIADLHEQVCDADHTQTNSGVHPATLGNFDYVWSMIAWSPPTGKPGWIQSGFERSYNTDYRYFSQARLADQTIIDNFSVATIPYNETDTYRQSWYQPTGYMRSIVNSSILISVPQSDWNATGYANWVPEASNEAAYLSSDVPGTASSPTQITAIQYESNDGTGDFTSSGLGPLQTQNFSGSYGQPCIWTNRWGESSSISNHEFDVWNVIAGENPNC
jgi:hypothetical protein